nr:MAG TPA: hypothetical protein [Caudoviricetes sp.]
MHTLECNAKISHHPIYGNAFDKTNVNKTKIPHFAYNVPCVERRTSTKQGISDIHPNALLREAGRIC